MSKNTPKAEAPLPEDNRDTTENLVNAIWQAGWKAGHKRGWSAGYDCGKSAMNTWWAVVAVVVAFAFGSGVGYSVDWVHTCQPIAVTDVKSCTTRFGNE